MIESNLRLVEMKMSLVTRVLGRLMMIIRRCGWVGGGFDPTTMGSIELFDFLYGMDLMVAEWRALRFELDS